MRRFRPHRMAGLVLTLLVAASIGAATTAQRVVDDNEARLLKDRTEEVASLLESIGTSFEAQLSSVASVAQATGGDPEQFRAAVAGVSGEAGTGAWGLLRRTPDGWADDAAVGTVTPFAQLPADWGEGLDYAASGRFTVLGFLGEGFTRRFAMAAGRPGVTGDLVVFSEIPLAAAAGASADQANANPLTGVALELFIGTTPDPDQVLLQVGRPDESKEERRVVDISGVSVLLEVSASEPLGGTLATRLPVVLLFGGCLLGLAIASVVEMSQRRRDDALATVRDLERQNERLDHALAEQQAAEAARAALEVELQKAQRLEAVGHLAGGVAHDFNNVLAAILSYADLAADEIDDAQVLADLESIRSAARRGAGLTRQLLQFSRREVTEAVVVDVNDRITDVVGMLERTLGEDVQVLTRLSDGPAPVLADPVELDQIVLNLVVNARDAIGSGGTIEVSTETVGLSEGDLASRPTLRPGPHIRLTVVDDGHGMAPDVLHHVFEPFFTTKGRGQGTGLGLSTVYGIVQRQGGHVAAQSAPGAGTCIEVLLPAASPSSVTAATPPPSEVTSPGGYDRTVLLVEDEAELRNAVRRMLERGGFTVLEAADGQSALDHHGRAAIDLLVTDVVMSGALTGVDLAEGLRSRRPELSVVFMTGYSDDILDPERLAGQGPTVLLSKPFSEPELLRVVDSAVGAAR